MSKKMTPREKSDYVRKFQDKAKEMEKRQMVERQVQSSPVLLGSKPQGAQIRVLTLNHGEHQDSTLYRLDKGTYLQFSPGPSLLGRRVILYCNYVMPNNQSERSSSDQVEFVRNQYYSLEWHQGDPDNVWSAPTTLGTGILIQDTDVFCEILLSKAGSFHYYFVYVDGEPSVGPQGSGFFHVAPTLRFGRNKETLSLDCIQCQTVMAKCLGPLSTWESKLRVSKESGYNMVHFTPIQELGGSNSGYSLANQLKLNPMFSKDLGREATFEEVEQIIIKMRTEWKVLSICDIVLNHTANESTWLLDYPESTYNLYNCPHLRPSGILDFILAKLTEDIGKGYYEARGIPRYVTQNDHLENIKYLLKTQLLPEAKIHECYMCNTNEIVQEFYYMARNKVPPVNPSDESKSDIKLIQDPHYRRLKTQIDLELALQKYNIYRPECYDEETRLKKCTDEFKKKLDELNQTVHDEIWSHLICAVDNCIAGMRYFRIQSDGPRIAEVSSKNPLVPCYFTFGMSIKSLADFENQMYGADGRFIMAHNGWVMNADPLQDFANVKEGTANVYLRRELIAWGDSVKLRYGEKPEDSPFLWKHMREYVEMTAKLFDGIRLDNCHSTPLHVAEYLLDCARNVKPELYVVAELFTNSDQVDNIFVNRLGITSLIREALSAWDSHEEGRLVYRYGGRPVGAFLPTPRRPLTPNIAHALFLDLTHDNECPITKRSVFDLLPSSALVSMACCASGSTRGYDELVPHHIHVVDENRQYSEWAGEHSSSSGPDSSRVYVNSHSGIISAKKALNKLHFELGNKGYDQVYVDQMDQDIVAVTRHEPRSRQSVIMVSYTAFSSPDPNFQGRPVKPLKFEGKLEEILLEATVKHVDHRVNGPMYQKLSSFSKNSHYINGLADFEVNVKQKIPLNVSSVFEGTEEYDGKYTILTFRNFFPGTIVAIRVSMRDEQIQAFQKLHSISDAFHSLPHDAAANHIGLAPIINAMTLGDYNVCLYRCDQEEKDGGASGIYDIPGHGTLTYAGLQGFVSLLSEIAPNNDLGHPMCSNLRDGNWMIDYIWQRLERYNNLGDLINWYKSIFQPLKEIPRYLIPSYFEMLILGIYKSMINGALNKMSVFSKNGSSFVQSLSMVSVQCGGAIKSSELPQLSPHISPPRPTSPALTLSAGLPHFSSGYMRCWGRDTFISVRGLFILTGRYHDARYHILAYAQCLRHGLIPNLLDGGINPRFNCRDAVWWWLQAIKDYVNETQQGHAILQEPVSRIFPTDDSPACPAGQHEQPLYDVIQEAMEIHFQGKIFRERNAGRAIDAHMTDKGFNNQIGVNPETGFIFGGNEANCGTWMDKMGSSELAGNKGKPATPRDGSAVELVGLCKSVVTWLSELNTSGKYPYAGVQRKHRDGTITTWSYAQWAEKIQQNFERFFWIHTSPSATDLRPDLVHRRGIYKDSHGATQPWADYQLRCNFPIAMAVAPELFDPYHAWVALENYHNILLGPLGVKTLDPDDWAYRGDYDNSNHGTDPNTAHGFNYHQGPEWVWPIGFYLRARLNFAQENKHYLKTIYEVYSTLSAHVAEIEQSPWKGLPELTNSNGSYCKDSCRTQAWSSATVLEALYELRKWHTKKPLTPVEK